MCMAHIHNFTLWSQHLQVYQMSHGDTVSLKITVCFYLLKHWENTFAILIWTLGYNFFKLNSPEHGVSDAYKIKNAKIYVHILFTIEPRQIYSFPTGSLYGHM